MSIHEEKIKRLIHKLAMQFLRWRMMYTVVEILQEGLRGVDTKEVVKTPEDKAKYCLGRVAGHYIAGDMWTSLQGEIPRGTPEQRAETMGYWNELKSCHTDLSWCEVRKMVRKARYESQRH